ncbi:hypothetical protein N2152v2_004989 [Parachlorella kessleri]
MAARASVSIQASPSRLAGVEMAPPDPILGVTEAFKRDTADSKLNLGVGAYRTEELQPYVLEVVQKAEENMLRKKENKEYLPIEGLAAFRQATVDLLLGSGNPAVKEGRVAVLQSLSGTGSLRVGAAFIGKFMPGTTVYISNPTWGNHKNIFTDAGVPWKEYRYFDKKTVGLDLQGMLEDIQSAPEGSVILLHGCAHNPTGVDPTKEEWAQVADLITRKNHFAFFDVAYQGFASGDLDEDAYAPRYFVERGLEVMVAQSYSKNLASDRLLPLGSCLLAVGGLGKGLYAERIGALNVVLADKAAADRVLSQLKRIARALYSNPPVHGARIVAECVGNEEMFSLWKKEMDMMAGRIKGVRQALYDELVKLHPEKDWTFVLKQIGMFSFTGLNPAQASFVAAGVENMTSKWHVYMTKDGRISLAGLSLSKAAYLAEAIVDSFRNH